MANSYFNHDDPAKAGTKVAAAQFNNTMQAVQAGFDAVPTPTQFLLDNARYGTATVGAANVFNLTLAQISASYGYVEGMGVLVKFPVNNTGPAQLNINGLGLKEMRSPFGAALVAGDLIAGVIYDLRYDGTYFQVLNAVESSLTTVSDLLNQATISAGIAATQAGNATLSATQAATSRNQAATSAADLEDIVDNIAALPLATPTTLGLVYLVDDFTGSPVSGAALSAIGGNSLYSILEGKAPTLHTHAWAQITGVPVASTSTAGIVQLYNGTDSTSTTLAATANSVRTVSTALSGKADTIHTHPWSQITGVPVASTSVAGIVKLSNSLTADDSTVAATASVAKSLMDIANGKAPTAHTHTWTQITGVPQATTAQAGIVQLNDTLTSTSTTLALTANQGRALKVLVDGKAASTHTHDFSQILNVPLASTTVFGLTKITDATTGGTSNTAASALSVYNIKLQADDAITALDIGSTAVGGVVLGYVTTGSLSPGGTTTALRLSDMAGTDRGALTGTWRCGGYSNSALTGANRVAIFTRTA